jgi:hypothetical protein
MLYLSYAIDLDYASYYKDLQDDDGDEEEFMPVVSKRSIEESPDAVSASKKRLKVDQSSDDDEKFETVS